MPRISGRSHDDTRRLILDSAAAVVGKKGITATLDEIVREAGVSKGGLLYHFATKDELITALAVDLLETFRTVVHGMLDPADTASGRLTRAYIRASFRAHENAQAAREEMSLIVQLLVSPAVADVARADAARWRADLAADGLPDETRALVVAAADGATAGALWGDVPDVTELDRLHDQLLRLTLT